MKIIGTGIMMIGGFSAGIGLLEVLGKVGA